MLEGTCGGAGPPLGGMKVEYCCIPLGAVFVCKNIHHYNFFISRLDEDGLKCELQFRVSRKW